MLLIDRLTHYSRISAIIPQIQEHLPAHIPLLELLPANQMLHTPGRKHIYPLPHKTDHIFLIQLHITGLLLLVDHVRQRQPIRRKNARVLADHNLSDAQRARYRAGMLAAGATKTRQDMLPRVVALPLRQIPDRSTHGLIGNTHKARRQLFDRQFFQAFFFNCLFIYLSILLAEMCNRIPIDNDYVIDYAIDFQS